MSTTWCRGHFAKCLCKLDEYNHDMSQACVTWAILLVFEKMYIIMVYSQFLLKGSHF
jgi:hypothetical protein